ncbi:hypothetical protein KI688_002956 [Linnemannia hyalina]|uniref:Uncharacterized protein n=1 Tax=Linnemannia hyalina TaxID=64524 RepID=A0A9P7XPI1_9FUNG|nr:hypothetical protein KI688_002956 [Linnemannia hyalina]
MIPVDAWDDHVVWEIFSRYSGTNCEFQFRPIRRCRHGADDFLSDSPHLTTNILTYTDVNESLMGAILESLPKSTVKSTVFEGF